MNFSIAGFWSTRAGDYSPQQTIKTTIEDYRYFFRLVQDSVDRVKRIIRIYVDGEEAGELHDWMSTDGREDDYFDVPLKFRTIGEHSVQFRVFEPQSAEADSGAGQCVFVSDRFTLAFVN